MKKTGFRAKGGFKRKWRQYWDLYLLLPVLLYFIIFHYAPMYGMQIAFKQYNPVLGITGSEWNGFTNFTRFFQSFYFERLLKNTIVLSLYQLLASFPVPIILAVMISEMRDGGLKKGVQLVLYAPRFISIVVVVGILGCMFSLSGGVVNNALEALGHERADFLTDPRYFKTMYVFSGIWQNAGWNSIIYIAAASP